MKELFKTFSVILIVLLPFAFAASLGVVLIDIGREQVRQQAVDAGAAEWTVDENGVRGFRWRVGK